MGGGLAARRRRCLAPAVADPASSQPRGRTGSVEFSAEGAAALTVASLHVYPVKSCRGLTVDALPLDPRGPIGDREWMVVDPEGRFVTQRDEPRLALVDVHRDVPTEPSALRLSAAGEGEVGLGVAVDAPLRPVKVWRHEALAEPARAECDAWISELLGRRVGLVRFPAGAFREANPRHAPPDSSAGLFSDGYPLLATTEASLDELCRRLPEPVPMVRFRPNVVVRGGAPFDEDGWRELRIGEVELLVAKPCERCVVTTIDPRTGEKGKEPLATLATFRRAPEGVLFGQNLVHRAPGTLRVGDPVRILGRG
ncbi:MAG: MOSC domain-containing protein [Deltaproteobacteria bacterium]|nr:MOSC domain-containing protein [Deltaproteobacteria bacterium]